MTASRAALPVALAFGAASVLGGVAAASTPGLVVDAASGKVLFEDQATVPWYPASVTKLMTVYVALDQARQGRTSLDRLLVMSPEAASQPPSKLGLKPGGTMTLDNALKVIMVKSANDIATMIGENLGGGSVEGFAELMNEASRRLGMIQSNWANPSGLPDDRQRTSARDMAILARALINEFPQHEALFRIGAVKYGQSVMRNHNGLLGRYPGVDGMKTGFICSGGFNLVASASQGGRRIITVVFGYGSARERDLRAADLFDAGFSSSGGFMGRRVEELPLSGVMSPPNMRPIVCGGGRKQPQEEEDGAAVAAAASYPSGSAENPIASLFAPSAAFAASPAGAPTPGARRTLGPRPVFEPVVVWAGARPGAEPALEEDEAPRGKRSRIARGGGKGGKAAARAVAEPPPPVVTPVIASDGEEKPRLGAIAARSGKATGQAQPASPRHGAIAARPNGTGAVAGLNPDAEKATARKGKPASARTADAKPAAKRDRKTTSE